MNPLAAFDPAAAVIGNKNAPSIKKNVSGITPTTGLDLAPVYTDGLHPDARVAGKARADLTRAWHSFKEMYAQQRKSLTQANIDFAGLYNSGHLMPHLFEVLGKTAWQTISKWAQGDPTKSYDYVLYAPGYIYKGHGECRIALTETERSIFEKFLFSQNEMNISQAIFYAKTTLKMHGTPTTVGDHTFRRYANWLKQTHKDAWTFLRDGKKALTDDVIFSLIRDKTKLEVGQVLVADGHRLNFQIIDPATGKPCRASMIAFLDWRSGDLCGFEIMVEENTQVIASALRSSIIYLGKFPKYVYQDNGKAFRAKYFQSAPSFDESGFYGLYMRFNMTPIFSMPYNARAKVIERWWKEFNSFERLQLSYTGASIEDKPAWMQRNEKWHKALRGEFVPDIYETCEMIGWWLELRRETSLAAQDPQGRTIGQLMAGHRGPGIEVDDLDELMMEEKVTKIYANGIKHNKEWYWAEELYGSDFGEVVKKYSILDKDSIKVYTRTGQRICTARRWDKQHPLVHYEGTEVEKERFKDVISLQAAMKKKTVIKSQQLIGGKPLMVREAEEKKRKEEDDAPVVDSWERIPDEYVIDLNVGAIPCDRPTVGFDEMKEEEGRIQGSPLQTDDCEQKGTQTDHIPDAGKMVRPFFGENTAKRYEWHLKHGFETPEDLRFKVEFEDSDSYRVLKEYWTPTVGA